VHQLVHCNLQNRSAYRMKTWRIVIIFGSINYSMLLHVSRLFANACFYKFY